MTKAQERKALEEIKAILEKAGADSYIGMAFNGCVELAESNIDNDFGNDPKKAAETLRENLKEAQREAEEYREAYNNLRERFNDRKEQDHEVIFNQTSLIEKLKAERSEAQRSLEDREAQLKAKDDEIIKLKAKLYDLMTA